MKGLSVIIVSFNTKEITLACIQSLHKALSKCNLPFEIIVVDNNSEDGSMAELIQISNVKSKNYISNLKVILNKENVGYGRANNQGLKKATYDYILFFNSDVLVEKQIVFTELIEYMEKHEKVGVLTVQVNLPDGSYDPASHRGFPTLWRSFCYFSGLERIFSSAPFFNKIFGGYHLTHLDKNIVHEIDSPTGAFYLTRFSLMRKLNGFDEDFFMYGEDLDLSYRIKELGLKIIYYPKYSVTHYKYQSGLKSKKNEKMRKKTKQYFYEAMSTFYKKHYEAVHPSFVNYLVYFFIKMRSGIYEENRN